MRLWIMQNVLLSKHVLSNRINEVFFMSQSHSSWNFAHGQNLQNCPFQQRFFRNMQSNHLLSNWISVLFSKKYLERLCHEYPISKQISCSFKEYSMDCAGFLVTRGQHPITFSLSIQCVDKGSSIKYVRTEEGCLGRCVRIAYTGGGGSGCCARTHFVKYSSKVFTFNKLYIIVEQTYRHKLAAWKKDLSILYYAYHFAWKNDLSILYYAYHFGN